MSTTVARAATPRENIPPTEPEFTPGGGEIPDIAIAQLEVLRLEDLLLRRLLMESPAVVSHAFGAGAPAEHTIAGDQRDPFNGVAVINPSSAVVYVGFQAGTATGSATSVQPGSYLVLPRRYANLSLAVSATDAAGPAQVPVTALRLRMPPTGVSAGPLGGALASAQTAANPGIAVTVGVAGVASAVAANPARREIIIVNASANLVTLALGPGIPTGAYAGIPLEPGGGAFTDTVWGGPISMLAAANGTVVSVVEI